MPAAHTARPAIACNDNGAFASVRRPRRAPRDILAVAISMAAPLSLDQVSEGVLVITRGEHAPRGARRSSH